MKKALPYTRLFLMVMFSILLGQGCIDTSQYNKIYCSKEEAVLFISIQDTIGGVELPIVLDRFEISSRQRDKWEIDTAGFHHRYYIDGKYPYCTDKMLPMFYQQTTNPTPTQPATGNVSADTLDLKGWKQERLMLDTFVVVSGNICHVYKVKGPDVIYQKH